MELLQKLEHVILRWVKNVPHLPVSLRRWLGVNIWWIILIGVIINGIWILFQIVGIFGMIAFLGSPGATYQIVSTITSWSIVTSTVGTFFTIVVTILSGLAIQPLQSRLKKGWVLLFAAWLVSIIGVIVGAVLSLNPVFFVINLLFGAIFTTFLGYVLFELHGQFAHEPKKTKTRR